MIKKLNYLFTNKDKKKLFLLLLMSLVLSVVETIGITAIMPFISIASDNSLIFTNHYYNLAFNLFSFANEKDFIISFGMLLIIFYLIRGIYIVFYGYLINKFSMDKYTDFVNDIFKNYMHKSYKEFVTLNTSSMSKTLTSEAYQLAFVIQNIMIFISEIIIISLLYILLLFVNLKMTLLLTIILGIKILFLKLTISQKIKKKGDIRAELQNNLYKIIQETFGNFKIIKFISNQQQISNKFFNITKDYSRVYTISNALQLIPRSVLEMTGFSMLIGVIIYIVTFTSEITNMIPVVSMYALALYRILPAITKILNSYNNIIFHSKSLDIVYNDIYNKNVFEGSQNIFFMNFIKIENINFAYSNGPLIVKNINLEIEKGKKIAFTGESGSGKSTLIDLICGLYRPTSGKIFIDNIELDNSNIVSWRKKIGYIPQSIYLFDGTVLENVVFGRKYDEIKFVNVLKKANIYDLIMEKDGFDTIVGENGIQLSGGQKQRIGIARALYDDPEILVLDEATSALDEGTEQLIMDEIYKISEDKTLLVIAHRLSTIEKCDVTVKIGELTNE